MNELEEMLTADEIDGVLAALIEGQGAAGTTEEDWDEAVAWANKARINNALLNLVLDRRVVMRVEDGGGFRFVAKECAAPSRQRLVLIKGGRRGGADAPSA